MVGKKIGNLIEEHGLLVVLAAVLLGWWLGPKFLGEFPGDLVKELWEKSDDK